MRFLNWWTCYLLTKYYMCDGLIIMFTIRLQEKIIIRIESVTTEHICKGILP